MRKKLWIRMTILGLILIVGGAIAWLPTFFNARGDDTEIAAEAGDWVYDAWDWYGYEEYLPYDGVYDQARSDGYSYIESISDGNEYGINYYGYDFLQPYNDEHADTHINELSGFITANEHIAVPMVAAGWCFSVALMRDGTVWTWGCNLHGKLGDGTTIDREIPVRVLNFNNVSAVAAGRAHIVSLRYDGTVWAWGENAGGQIGDGVVAHSSVPVQVQNLSDMIAVAAGSNHSVALRNDGTVWTWGENWDGQLGDGTITSSSVPVQVQNLNDVIAIAAGHNHTVALRSDGTVWAWGSNWSGQLGYDDTTAYHTTPIRVLNLDNVLSIAAGGNVSTALRNDGTIWAWGDNLAGQLGDSSTTNNYTPVRVQNVNNMIAVATGDYHSTALMDNGTVWAWGNNLDGQIGDDSTIRRYAPVQTLSLNNVTAVAAGGDHSLALRDDGTVWAWGRNRYGRLGDGTITNRNIPVQVRGFGGDDGFFNLDSDSTYYEPPPLQTPSPQPTPSPSPMPRPSPTPSPPPIQTIPTPIGPHALQGIHNMQTAVQAVRNVAAGMPQYQLDAGLLELFAENAIARAASIVVQGNSIIVSQSTVEPLQNIALNTRSAINALFQEIGHVSNRELSPSVSFVSYNTHRLDIQVEPSTNNAIVQHIRIRAPHYEIALPQGFIASEVANQPLTIRVLPTNSVAIHFSRGLSDAVRVSLQPLPGSTTYQTLRNSGGQAVGGRHNPATGMLDARVRESGIYTVVENRVNFSDISHLSQETQRAIRTLASQGIVSGTGGGRFSPNNSINRAEVAALTIGMLGRLDPNANGNFADVRRSDWFFGAAGSANRHGLMHGTGGNMFSPRLTMPRDQLVALSARVLRVEMGYRTPANPNNYLNRFSDRGNLASWSHSDIALATRENLVVHRADGRFMPNSPMTRGDAALMLYRMYLRLW